MLFPMIVALILAVVIGRTGKKLNTPSALPTTAAVLVFLFFAFGTTGAIKVRPDEITKGVVLGILLYLGVALVIYIGAFIWMKSKSPLTKEKDQALERDGAVSDGVLRFRTFLGVRGTSIDWLYPLGLFLGFGGMAVVTLLRNGSGVSFLQQVVADVVLVGLMVLGFYFLRHFKYPFIALVIALVFGGLNFLVLSLLRSSADTMA